MFLLLFGFGQFQGSPNQAIAQTLDDAMQGLKVDMSEPTGVWYDVLLAFFPLGDMSPCKEDDP